MVGAAASLMVLMFLGAQDGGADAGSGDGGAVVYQAVTVGLGGLRAATQPLDECADGGVEVNLLRYLALTEMRADGTSEEIPTGLDGGLSESFLRKSSTLRLSWAPLTSCSALGEIHVRARIIREPPVELQVENYTTVDGTNLKSETPALLASHLRLEEQLDALESAVMRLEQAIEQERVARFPLEQIIAQDAGFAQDAGVDEIREMLTTAWTATVAVPTVLESVSGSVNETFKRDAHLRVVSDSFYETFAAHIFELRMDISERATFFRRIVATKPSAMCKSSDLSECERQIRAFVLQSRYGEDDPLTARAATSEKNLVEAIQSRARKLRNDLKMHLRQVYEKRLQVEGRLRLHALRDLRHGETVELSIVNLLADSRQFVWKLAFRIVDYGFSYRIAPQFVLIKRASDVSSPSGTELPANFAPAPGVLLAGRYRRNGPGWDWLFPSFGFLVSAVHFDAQKSLELGLGVSVGVLNELIHVGVGVNAMTLVDWGWRRSLYYFLALDFAQTFSVLGGLLGAPQSGDSK